MNFYVPTIGDSIYLLEPWTFTLHQEGRNEGLAKRLAQCGSVKEHVSRRRRVRCTAPVPYQKKYSWICANDYEYKIGDERTLTTGSIEYDNFIKSGHWEDIGNDDWHWKSFEWKGKTAEVTLPKGTELKIDRVYIKSTYREFDSITFRIGKCEVNKKLEKARFWVKLKDANRIVCDLYPVYDLDAARLFPRDQRFASICSSE